MPGTPSFVLVRTADQWLRCAHTNTALDATSACVELGTIVDEGTHQSLLARPNSLYARLWRMQQHEGDA